MKLGSIIADAMKIKNFQQSYHDYQTTGEFIDYAYQEFGTYALTVEVSKEATPPPSTLPNVVQRTVKGILAFAFGLETSIGKSH